MVEKKTNHVAFLSSIHVFRLLLSSAKDNLIFLQRWFNKFPHYKHRNLFLTGESYAGTQISTFLSFFLSLLKWKPKKKDQIFFLIVPGHYVPQLARLMTEFNRKEKLFNLKGIAVSFVLCGVERKRKREVFDN